MTLWDALLLGALQGVTEFLPVSSSGHLVLAQYFLGFSDDPESTRELFFDGMLHLGTLLAVLLYFGGELRAQMRAVWAGHPAAATWPATWPQLLHLGALVALATLPAVAMAVWFDDTIKESFNRPYVVAVNFLFLGGILIATDILGRLRPGATAGPQTRWWQVLLIGGGQACSAVFRGLSRSGMTIGVSLIVGLERAWAVRFSFLMSVVASLGLGTLGIRKALTHPTRDQWLTPEFLGLTLFATAVSAVVGYLTITPLIRLVQKCRLWWFAVYVWIVGTAVLFLGEPLRAALAAYRGL